MNLLVITYTYFCLLASPHATGIVDQIPPEELRRGLMLLSKVRGWLSRNIVGRSVRPSVSSQSHSQSTNQSMLSTNRSVTLNPSVSQSCQSINQSINWSSSQSFSQSVSQSTSQSLTPSARKSAVYQSGYQWVYLVRQSVDSSASKFVCLIVHRFVHL